MFIYPYREREKGTGEEKSPIYPSREQEEGTGEERLFIYPSREREEGTEEEKLLIYPRRGQLAYKMAKVIKRICCFSGSVCYNIDS